MKKRSEDEHSNEQFKRVDLNEFMAGNPLPQYDTSIQWKPRKEIVNRRKPEFRQKTVGLPSLGNQVLRNSLIRQHSVTSNCESRKKLREDSPAGTEYVSCSGDEMETQESPSNRVETKNAEHEYDEEL